MLTKMTPKGSRNVNKDDPEGGTECSRGWSEAEPVVRLARIQYRPGGAAESPPP